MKKPLVTLLSDFGTVDGFVGAMKGVIFSIAPDATVVDLTHEIPAQDVRAGAWALREAAPHFPPGTIHVAVVDPEVGTARRPLALECRGHWFVGPDNGLLSLAAEEASTGIALDRPEYHRPQVSNTFHGRDIFAPAAGHLAAGVAPRELGHEIKKWARITVPAASFNGDRVMGQVIHVDQFGNLITNIRARDLPGGRAWRLSWLGKEIGPLRQTFGDVASGQWVAYAGSSGQVEIGIRDGRAAQGDRAAVLQSEVTACLDG